MSRRHFVETIVREEGQPVPRYRLVCGSCGCGGQLGRMNFGPAIADEQVPQKFEALGWRVGKRRDGRDDRCPSCVNREQEARRRHLHVVQSEESEPVAQNNTPVPKPVLTPSPVDKPREMSRDERRLIFAKLDEIYIDERSGYSAGWTDARVANDLGIPRAWVTKIRDENFGPGTSEEVEKFLAEAAELAKIWGEIRTEQDMLRERICETQKRVEALERSSKRIEAASR